MHKWNKQNRRKSKSTKDDYLILCELYETLKTEYLKENVNAGLYKYRGVHLKHSLLNLFNNFLFKKTTNPEVQHSSTYSISMQSIKPMKKPYTTGPICDGNVSHWRTDKTEWILQLIFHYRYFWITKKVSITCKYPLPFYWPWKAF